MGQRLKTTWEHFNRYKPLMRELVMRDLKVKYRRSLLGYLWSLLNPLLMMCVMMVVFSIFYPLEGVSAPIASIIRLNSLYHYINFSAIWSSTATSPALIPGLRALPAAC